VVPGLWRLPLPLPWPGVPHGNEYAIAAGDGVVLVDTGLHESGSLRRLELWMHPDHEHMTNAASEPECAFEGRLEIARQSGVPAESLAAYEAARRNERFGVAEIVLPDRDLVDGVEVYTDLGRWRVYETPGHAPSHVVLHQPERGLLLSGDHLLGRVSLFYDFGYSPDPAGEFLASLDRVDALDVQLILAGHGRPVRAVHERLGRVRQSIAGGPRAAFEIVPEMVDHELPGMMMIGWA
jgi:glyoxylase-like metal-dependent hydrolase (beta-lactamase superfamily II)